jgi:hypothetical protein
VGPESLVKGIRYTFGKLFFLSKKNENHVGLSAQIKWATGSPIEYDHPVDYDEW